ncbi:hypothetical protein D3C87_1368630 [compost metagenome]
MRLRVLGFFTLDLDHHQPAGKKHRTDRQDVWRSRNANGFPLGPCGRIKELTVGIQLDMGLAPKITKGLNPLPTNKVVVGILEVRTLIRPGYVGAVDKRRNQIEIAHFFKLFQMLKQRHLHRCIIEARLPEVVFQLFERIRLFQAQCRVDVVFRIVFKHLITGPVTDVAITLMPGFQFFF